MLSRIMIIGAMLNGALFLIGCVTIGVYLGLPMVWKSALAAFGLAYANYCLNFYGFLREENEGVEQTRLRLASTIVWGLSLAAAVIAGVGLLLA